MGAVRRAGGWAGGYHSKQGCLGSGGASRVARGRDRRRMERLSIRGRRDGMVVMPIVGGRVGAEGHFVCRELDSAKEALGRLEKD